jgi:hypothetical protein
MVGGGGRARRPEGSDASPYTAEGVLQEKAGMVVAKIVEFYIPNSFQKKVEWVSPARRGRVIEFGLRINKSA